VVDLALRVKMNRPGVFTARKNCFLFATSVIVLRVFFPPGWLRNFLLVPDSPFLSVLSKGNCPF